MFFSRFAGLLGFPEARGKKSNWLLEPKIGPTLAQKLLKVRFKSRPFFKHLFSDFWSRFQSILGAILGSERAKKHQDGPEKDVKSLKVPKNSICKKCDFTIGKQYFSSLGGSQDKHKTLKKALKRH